MQRQRTRKPNMLCAGCNPTLNSYAQNKKIRRVMDVKPGSLRPQITSFSVRRNHYLLRNIVSPDSGPASIHLFSFRIPVSNMDYCDEFLACIGNVEREFYSLLENIEHPGEFIAVDCSGSVTRYPTKEVLRNTIPMYELVASNKAFTTTMLGCCVTYSHPAFGSHCLTCAVITSAEPAPELCKFLDSFT